MSKNDFLAPEHPNTSVPASVESDLSSLSARVSGCAAEACREIARAADPLISAARELHYAVFDDDGGGLALLAHSRLTKRQVTFEISPEGNLTVISIDEALRRHEHALGQIDAASVWQPIEWLVSRA
jgi:hypothetical protein